MDVVVACCYLTFLCIALLQFDKTMIAGLLGLPRFGDEHRAGEGFLTCMGSSWFAEGQSFL